MPTGPFLPGPRPSPFSPPSTDGNNWSPCLDDRPPRPSPLALGVVPTGSLGRPVGDAPWPTDQLVSRPPLPRPVPTGPSVAPPRGGGDERESRAGLYSPSSEDVYPSRHRGRPPPWLLVSDRDGPVGPRIKPRGPGLKSHPSPRRGRCQLVSPGRDGSNWSQAPVRSVGRPRPTIHPPKV